jgi:hypothetical protein
MALYYFHLCDGVDLLLDPEGRELASDLVGAAAMAEARAIVSADVQTGRVDLAQRIEVHDANGQIVYSVEFEDAVHVTHNPERIR